MTMTADQIVDRRRLRRKLTLLARHRLRRARRGHRRRAGRLPPAATRSSASPGRRSPASPSPASSPTTATQSELLDKLAKADGVKGVIVAINSTGGATAGGEALYEGLRKLAAKKPTVATIGTVGASAAYMAAIATDHIVARRTSITGSIGVIFEFPEVSELLDKLGVRSRRSRARRSRPSRRRSSRPPTEAKAVIAGIIADTYNWFVDIVAERRKLARADALTLADGRIFTGRQALDAKLIDEIGGEDAAIAWLATKGVDAQAAGQGLGARTERRRLLQSPTRPCSGWRARSDIAPELLGDGVLDRLLPERLKLDGLLSVWQGSAGGDERPAEGAAQ